MSPGNAEIRELPSARASLPLVSNTAAHSMAPSSSVNTTAVVGALIRMACLTQGYMAAR